MAEILFPRAATTERSTAKTHLAPVAIAIAASAFVALCAHAALPLLFTPVPLSLAPFAVLLLGLLLGPRLAFASLCLYLFEGAAGLPVFSATGVPGILHLMGPTGGYLLSYPFAAALAGYLYRLRERTPRRDAFVPAMLSSGAASLLILIAGALWLKVLTHADFRLVLSQAVIPFLPGDVLKVVAAAGIANFAGAFQNRRMKEESL